MDNITISARRKNRYAAPIGGVFIILCVVGFITILVLLFNLTKNLVDNSAKKQEYERMLLPVVMFDPVPFEDPATFEELPLLQTCIWATLLGENRGGYQYDEMAMMVVPASDVDVTAQKLFGPAVALEHQSFGDYENTYLYDETTRSYHVPVDTMTGFFTPRVMSIDRQGDIISLEVGYIAPSTALEVVFGDEESEQKPVKYMIYELHKTRSGEFLYAIRDIEGATLVPGVSISFSIPEEYAEGAASGSVSDGLAPIDGASSGGSSSDRDLSGSSSSSGGVSGSSEVSSGSAAGDADAGSLSEAGSSAPAIAG